MLLVLAAFAITPLIVPVLISRWGPRAFLVAAIMPAVAFVATAWQTPRVLAGDIPFESITWIEPLGIQLSMRMDTLSWLMALIVTGVAPWSWCTAPGTSTPLRVCPSSPEFSWHSPGRCTASCSPTTSSCS